MALVVGAKKEIAFLQQFGQPLHPFQRVRREAYGYQKQMPSDHIENIHRYLAISPFLVPEDPNLRVFKTRHPDLQPNNIIISKSSEIKISGIIDWQHTSILPLFLLAGIPQQLQNYDDPVSRSMAPPTLPNDFAELGETQQAKEMELFRRRRLHHHYVSETERQNKPHYAALTDPVGMLRRRLFRRAGDLWQGETLPLKADLIRAAGHWARRRGPPP